MDPLFSALGISVVVFAATNVDDLLMLIAFFTDRSIPVAAVVLGQFMGMGCLTALSVIAALLAISLPDGWTRWLGFVPLALGIRRSIALLINKWKIEMNPALQTAPIGSRKMSQIASVALVTIANGADNLGATIPLFATQTSFIWLFVVVFMLMTAIWCAASFFLMRHPGVTSQIGKFGHVLLPAILILLGLRLLFGW
jgi:cadmium resistance protein CadD (predicted permease)